MSIFNEDRAPLNDDVMAFDEKITKSGMDSAIQQAVEKGMNLDEIMYVLFSHTERVVRRYIVQDQIKKAANKDKS